MTPIFPINNFRNHLLKLLLFCFFSFFISSLFAQTNTTIEADYQDAIKKGDQYFSEEKYDKALYYFESASRLKPAEKYPKTNISVIKDLLDDQKTKNILFEVSITSAERWFKASEFKKAKGEYENALKINPTAQYPKDRLAQISKLWSDPVVDAAYAKAIMKADDLFSRKSYQGAKAEYMTASDLKRHEQYPLDRILEINDILASSQALQQAYDELINRGDDQFDQSEYETARDNYSKALGLKPDEIYPKNRISEIERILGDLLTQREEYEKIIALADDYYINNDFEKAKIEYRKAASTIPGERYPGNMISKLDPLIEEQQSIQRKYDLAISNADKYLQAEDYENAITSLQNAGEIKPEENYPKDKITEINGILAQIEAERQRQEQLALEEQQQQEQLALEEQQRQEQLALEEQKRQEQLVLEEKQRQEELRIEQEKQQQAYDDAIAAADQAFGDKDYQTALTSYSAADEIKPEENYPKDKITEINGILAQIEAERQRQEQLAMEEQQRQEQLALEEQQRQEQLALEEQQRQEQLALEEQKRQEQLLLEEQQRQEQLRIEQEKQQQAYDNAIAAADQAFGDKDYQTALTSYSTAGEIKPEENYPKDKITEINGILAQIEAERQRQDQLLAEEQQRQEQLALEEQQRQEQLALEEQNRQEQLVLEEQKRQEQLLLEEKQRQEQLRIEQEKQQQAYDDAIVEADQAFKDEDYQTALTSYSTAGEIKPAENYPKDKITEINGILAQIEAERQRQDQLLAEEQQRQEQLALEEQQRQEQLALEEQKRQEQLVLEEQKRQEQLLLEEKQRQEQLRIEQEKQQQDYDAAIATADQAFGDEDYQTALTSYSAASEIKPEENYPKDKITEINGIIAQIEAERQRQEQLAMEEQQRQKQLALEEQKRQEQLLLEEKQRQEQLRIEQEKQQQDYDAAIATADQAFGDEDYQTALTSYSAASEIKPEENYPKDKITEINGIIAQIEAERQRQEQLALEEQQRQEQLALEEQKRQEQSALEKQQQKAYDDAIKEADRLFVERSYETAKPKYQLALDIKPEEMYPRTRIRKIEELLAQKASRLRDYNNAITQGDAYFAEKKYQQATSSFEEALTLFPDEPYPKNKIDEIHSIIEALNIQKKYNDAIAKADLLFEQGNYEDAIINYQDAFNIKPDEKYPINKIDEINVAIQGNEVAKEKAYNNAIALADKYYSEEDYKNAKTHYQAAIKIYPDESYPRERLKEVEKLIQAREMELTKAYQKTIAKADDLYNKKILDQAIQAYRDAKRIKPDETYPDNRINGIRIFIEEHAIVELVASSVIIKNNSDEKYSFPPINIRFRKNNYILLKARIIGEDNAKVYLSYGQDGQKYGGIVLKSIKRGEINDYIIRISAQDPWYRNDNNWLSIYSEGGDIEVTSLQISQGD